MTCKDLCQLVQLRNEPRKGWGCVGVLAPGAVHGAAVYALLAGVSWLDEGKKIGPTPGRTKKRAFAALAPYDDCAHKDSPVVEPAGVEVFHVAEGKNDSKKRKKHGFTRGADSLVQLKLHPRARHSRVQ
jgi:hypothetical protein